MNNIFMTMAADINHNVTQIFKNSQNMEVAGIPTMSSALCHFLHPRVSQDSLCHLWSTELNKFRMIELIKQVQTYTNLKPVKTL
jgi:hypothetical protein